MLEPKIKLIIEEITSKLSPVTSVKKIILFGSRARGDSDPKSDIDIAINCPQASQRQWLSINEKIDEINTLLSIDVVRFDKVPDELCEKIKREGIVIYEQN
jgi:uncharacterized protein